ncbi:MAG: 23S rRNA (guanosine(2251)-2'-O)-methyltransferase RlmB [Cryomorphaceae bacterium]|nr:23S rRNA (guanosine(2251)-2'-O)-methyltransferase RlmB [Cryomorphaceae bacterium]
MHNTEEKNYIFGIRAIIEAVEAGKTIDKLFIQKGLHNDLFAELWKLVREKRINYKHVPLEKINRLTRKNHQGVFAFISPIDFHNIEDVIPKLYEEGKNPLVLVLDRITDVRNFGAIARTAECAGVDTILIPEQNAAAINADAIKTSAGSLHKVTVCRTWNLKLALQFMKESGIQLIGCTEKTQDDMYKPNYTTPTAIIIGSEEDGVSPEFLKMCDARAKIPMNGKIASLNVSVATGVILYEAIRQRG